MARGKAVAEDDEDDVSLADPKYAESGVELDGLSDDELMAVVQDALERIGADRLGQVIDLAQERRRAREDEVRNVLLTEFRARAEQLGLPFERLFPATGRRTRSDAGNPLPPKYRNPDTGETWSGRGQKARWLKDLEALGHEPAEFLVEPDKQVSQSQ